MKLQPTALLLCALLVTPAAVLSVTNHAIIIVMDGARYTETMGDNTHAYVPKIAALALQGAVVANFRTAAVGSIAESWSETCPGHARLTTGTYQNIENDGSELPTQPSFLQQYRKQTSSAAASAWVICSKDKLFVLANSSASGWNNQYQPSMSCGVNGDGSGGYRTDSQTHTIVKQKLAADRPALMVINYRGPDSEGHAGDWNGYLAAISEVDGYADDIWSFVQSDTAFQNETALFIVNDHGRHTSDYTSHGDACTGCCHVMCVALGPDIKTNYTSSTAREQIDLAPTIAELIGFTMSTSAGDVMTEILDNTGSGQIGEAGRAPAQPRRAGLVAPRNRSAAFSTVYMDEAIGAFDVAGKRLRSSPHHPR